MIRILSLLASFSFILLIAGCVEKQDYNSLQVIDSDIKDGQLDVEPGCRKVVVTFSQNIDKNHWSILFPEEYPSPLPRPHSGDPVGGLEPLVEKNTFSFRVCLSENTNYLFQIGREDEKFRTKRGAEFPVYIIKFHTK